MDSIFRGIVKSDYAIKIIRWSTSSTTSQQKPNQNQRGSQGEGGPMGIDIEGNEVATWGVVYRGSQVAIGGEG